MVLEARDVSFAYWDAPVLSGVSLAVAPCELVAVVGGNGSGKSTLGQVLSGALLPADGAVRCDRVTSSDPSSRIELRRLVGMVAQNPADQLVSSDVYDEVAFGPQNLGCSPDETERRVRKALAGVGLEGFERRDVNVLSGGEQQRLALAGVLAMEPRYVVLDEVTAMIDSAERPALRALVRQLAHERGAGVILITHDPLEALGADRVVVLDAGRVRWEGTPAAFVRTQRTCCEERLLAGAYARTLMAAVDAGYDLARGVEPEDLAPWCGEAGWKPDDAALGGARTTDGAAREPAAARAATDGAPGRAWRRGGAGPRAAVCLALCDVVAGYEDHEVLHGVNLALHAGEVLLVAGPSGAGKSTLATVAAGLLAPSAGRIELCTTAGGARAPRPGDVGLAFQHPEHQFFLPTVGEELGFAARNAGMPDDEVARRVTEVAAALGIAPDLLERDPFALSGGQARRVALASVLVTQPPAVVLDEPTSGLDAASRRRLHALVRALAARGVAVLLISHDLEEWMPVADRVTLVASGRIAWTGTPAALGACPDAFAAAGLRAPEAWRFAALCANREQAAQRAASEEGDGAHGGCGSAAHSAHTSAAAPAVPAASTGSTASAPAHPAALTVLDARVKLVLLFVAVVGIFLTPSAADIAVWFVGLALALHAAGLTAGKLVRSLRPALFLLCFILLANLVSCDGRAAVALAGPVGLNPAGALRAVLVIARIVFMVGASLVVTATTPPTQVAQACVALGRPLRRIGVPVDDVGLIISLALRFIPLVGEETWRIRMTQEARGVRFDEGRLTHRIGVWLSVLTPLVVGLFRRADRLAASMDARCFAAGARTPVPPRPLRGSDRAALMAGVVLMAALVAAARLLG